MLEIEKFILAANVIFARAQWLEQWPNHCPNCEGWGGRSSPGTYWEPPDFDICPCFDDGKCPRCGKEGWPGEDFDEEAPCEFCGWEPLNADGAPEEWYDYFA